MGATKRPAQPIRFVNQDADGMPVKRRQVHHACDSCKRRKKRCEHVLDADVESSDDGIEASDVTGRPLRLSPQAPDTGPPTATSSTTAVPTSPDLRHAQLDRAAPFLGDLNPEGIFVEATMTEVSKIVPVEAEDARLGIWGTTGAETLDKFSKDSLLTGAPVQVQDVLHTPHLVIPGDGDFRTIVPITDTASFARSATEAIVQELASVVRPANADWIAMRNIYMTKIHPIFPVFEESDLFEMSQSRTRINELMKASVCLAAASDSNAGKHLLLYRPVSGPWHRLPKLAPYSEYSQTVVSFIKEGVRTIPTRESGHLVNKLRTMALTCMFWQAEPDARSEPLDFYAGLVSIVHTYGIHLKEMVDMNEPETEGLGRGDVTRLFKCLYALDRLTAAFSGRPLMFHNYDLLMTPQSDKSDSPAFQLFMSIIMLLDKTINLYRPHAKEDHIDVPVLERLILDAGAQYEPDGILGELPHISTIITVISDFCTFSATLEILYHTVCVTSVRMPRDRFKNSPHMDAVSGVSYSHLPPSILNARRSHSSDRIFDIIKEYDRYGLSPMPFIPYGLALSLSVAYRKWRFSRTPMFRARGKNDFKEILPLLAKLGNVWTSARINSNLGDVVMAHVSQAEHQIASKTIQGAKRKGDVIAGAGKAPRRAHNNEHGRTGSLIRHTNGGLQDNTTLAPNRFTSRTESAPTPSNQQDQGSLSPTVGRARPAPDTSQATPPGQSSASWPGSDAFTPYTPSVAGTSETLAVRSDLLAEIDDTLFGSWALTDTVDSCFGSNLDPGNPFFWPEYSNAGGYQV